MQHVQYRNLIIALALVAIGIALTMSYVASRTSEVEAGQRLVRVLVARQQISEGTPADELQRRSLVEARTVRSDDAVTGAIDDLSEVGGRSIRSTIYPGDQLSMSKLATRTELGDSASIAGNQRLIALPFGSFQGVGGSVRGGDHVDVFASRAFSTTTETILVARDIPVVEVPKHRGGDSHGLGSNAGAGGEDVFVLQVSDTIAQRLVWANTYTHGGGLQMVLRPRVDATQTKLDTAITGVGA